VGAFECKANAETQILPQFPLHVQNFIRTRNVVCIKFVLFRKLKMLRAVFKFVKLFFPQLELRTPVLPLFEIQVVCYCFGSILLVLHFCSRMLRPCRKMSVILLAARHSTFQSH